MWCHPNYFIIIILPQQRKHCPEIVSSGGEQSVLQTWIKNLEVTLVFKPSHKHILAKNKIQDGLDVCTAQAAQIRIGWADWMEKSRQYDKQPEEIMPKSKHRSLDNMDKAKWWSRLRGKHLDDPDCD